jgi:predicted outer membrane repeat protein
MTATGMSDASTIHFQDGNHGSVFANIKVSENNASNSGGGIYISFCNSGLQFHNSSFISNFAGVDGGAICFSKENGNIC